MATPIVLSGNFAAPPMGEDLGTGRPVLEEFLIGSGTAMSPGIPWLAVQAVLTWLATRNSRWGPAGIALLGFHALLSGIFDTMEPLLRSILSTAGFEPLLALVEAANVDLPFLVVALVVLELTCSHRPQQKS